MLAQHSPGFDPATPWLDCETFLPGKRRLFQHFKVRRRSPHTDREHDFTRLLCPDWVNVVAFTARQGGELLLVEQFRHGIDASTLEVIGGVCDPGEDPALTARRELLEETGHTRRPVAGPGQLRAQPGGAEQPVPFLPGPGLRARGGTGPGPLGGTAGLGRALGRSRGSCCAAGTLDHALVMAAFLRLFLWPGWGDLERPCGRRADPATLCDKAPLAATFK